MTPLKTLQAFLARKSAHDSKKTAFVVFPSDEHASEFVAWEDNFIRALSGFTGENAELLVTEDGAYLFVDGRFEIQAPREVVKGITIGKKSRDSLLNFLTTMISKIDVLLYDGRRTPASSLIPLVSSASLSQLEFSDSNALDECWPDRPTRDQGSAWILEGVASGGPTSEKLAKVHQLIESEAAKGLFIANSADLSWLLNLRNDCTIESGLFLGEALFTLSRGVVFTDARVDKDIQSYLESLEIKVFPLGAKEHMIFPKGRILVTEGLSARDASHFKPKDLVVTDALERMRSVKTLEQIQAARGAFALEDRAFTRLLFEIKSGLLKDELEASLRLEELRRALAPDYRFPSFPSIIASGANAAIIHYTPSEKNHAPFPQNGFVLCDCGGQYKRATTDATRTILIGNATAHQKELYTRVLKAHIALARAVFPKGLAGKNLDVLARVHLWEIGLDYKHGTGHGVDLVGAVHAGPNCFNWHDESSWCFEAGMITSDEPGYYEEGAFGVRLESLLLTIEKKPGYLGFVPLTHIPFDLEPVEWSLLSKDESTWLLNYQKDAVEKLLDTPEADEAEYRDYLLKLLKPLSN